MVAILAIVIGLTGLGTLIGLLIVGLLWKSRRKAAR